jgi:hypothetical protein
MCLEFQILKDGSKVGETNIEGKSDLTALQKYRNSRDDSNNVNTLLLVTVTEWYRTRRHMHCGHFL